MKKLYYLGLLGFSLFEFLNIYFIMPMPGSQNINSIDLAYFLFSWRWVFRSVFIGMVLTACFYVFSDKKKWFAILSILLALLITYIFNFQMAADKMFLQAETIELKFKKENKIPGDRLVVGIEYNGESKAYPIEVLTYHHQIRDKIGGKEVMITYCSVCRTGRVYEPLVKGKQVNFRLVGMDHYNALFEDALTGSWWRQSTGEAITGELKGVQLPEFESKQMTVNKWFELHPNGKVMQTVSAFHLKYDTQAKFEKGKSKSSLTRTDQFSWRDKSWVVGIQIGNYAKAYDWKDLEKHRIINDKIGNVFIVLALSKDGQSFVAFKRPSEENIKMSNDTLICNGLNYDFSGQNLMIPAVKLTSIKVYQEFWHSWSTFHLRTLRFSHKN